MAQFDVYRNPGYGPDQPVAYLVDVQADYLSDFPTRVVIPLIPGDLVRSKMRGLNPTLNFTGAEYVLMSQMLAAVPLHFLGKKSGSLKTERDDIIRALDFLITG